jgi:nitrogen-specific signal transduction histidine kinase
MSKGAKATSKGSRQWPGMDSGPSRMTPSTSGTLEESRLRAQISILGQVLLAAMPKPKAIKLMERESEPQGSGLPDFARDKVFLRFFSTPRPVTGRRSSGLGLAIVREIAQLHHAEASLSPGPEGGCVAQIQFPAKS